MSKKNEKFENGKWRHFVRWIEGTYNPLEGELESNVTDEEVMADARIRYVHIPEAVNQAVADNYDKVVKKNISRVHILFSVFAFVFCLFMITVLLYAVNAMPAYGDPASPVNNEVSERYITQGLNETGAVNIVTGMILDYRAFDTFGESCVLFIASVCVLVLLRVDQEEHPSEAVLEAMHDRHYEPKNDLILQKAACFLVPVMMIFGIYIVLNGHLSPGGGFSGGAIMGSAMILYLTAFGYDKTSRMINEKVCKVLTVSALLFYCFAKSYSFYTGANHLESIIKPGTPGRIFSAGLILPLNICVGIVVACTMYSFYSLFRKGGLQ